MARRTPRQRIIRKLDRAFSIYTRYRFADENGRTRCFTCGTEDHPRNLHAGHFQSRRYIATRWDPDNVRPQCVNCNIYRNGQQYEFAKALDREEAGKADRIARRAQAGARYNLPELQQRFAEVQALADAVYSGDV